MRARNLSGEYLGSNIQIDLGKVLDIVESGLQLMG
jgi:hypothetical protein